MLIGLVQWFDNDKGFGVIGTPNTGDYFLHINNFSTRLDKVLKGTAIIFNNRFDARKNRNTAIDCRPLQKKEDWNLIMQFLGQQDTVNIEVKIKGRSRWGNPYIREETRAFSLMNISADQLFEMISEVEISKMVTDYFDDHLPKENFIPYCEYIKGRINKNYPDEKGEDLLNEIFTHFGENLNAEILFAVWKSKKFDFISYNELEDYEIPEKIITQFQNEIGNAELKRISEYSFGKSFVNNYIKSKFNLSESSETEDLR